jgi:hypothetical protein
MEHTTRKDDQAQRRDNEKFQHEEIWRSSLEVSMKCLKMDDIFKMGIVE